jgi:hypothetical protein
VVKGIKRRAKLSPPVAATQGVSAQTRRNGGIPAQQVEVNSQMTRQDAQNIYLFAQFLITVPEI